MPKGTAQIDESILRMALVGYEAELTKVNGNIAELRGLLDGRVKRPYKKRADVEAVAPIRKRRPFSAATKKRMAPAQKRRWKALKKAKKKNSEVPF